MTDLPIDTSDVTPPETTAADIAVEPRVQYGALPYRRRGGIEILLVTSRETQRWVIPKGWPMKRRTPYQAAAREAKEEAGIKGDIAKTALGAYGYFKRLPGGDCIPCRVEVFPLRVKQEAMLWREKGQRIRRWFKLTEAADAVDEPELKALIQAFGERGALKEKD